MELKFMRRLCMKMRSGANENGTAYQPAKWLVSHLSISVDPFQTARGKRSRLFSKSHHPFDARAKTPHGLGGHPGLNGDTTRLRAQGF